MCQKGERGEERGGEVALLGVGEREKEFCCHDKAPHPHLRHTYYTRLTSFVAHDCPLHGHGAESESVTQAKKDWGNDNSLEK